MLHLLRLMPAFLVADYVGHHRKRGVRLKVCHRPDVVHDQIFRLNRMRKCAYAKMRGYVGRAGHLTSLRLEPGFWQALRLLAIPLSWQAPPCQKLDRPSRILALSSSRPHGTL